MSESPAPPSMVKAFRLAYVLGLLMCVAWPLALQLLLGTAIRAGAEAPPDGVVRQLGYTFTGLTFASAAFVTWRWGRIRAKFREVPQARQPSVILRETLFYAALFELSALYGILYYALGGPSAERYGRSFVALSTVMFLVFVPRLEAWRDAAEGSREP